MIRDRVPDFPWPETFIDMLESMKEISGTAIFWETMRGLLEPVFWTRRRLGLKKEKPADACGGEVEAACSIVEIPGPGGAGVATKEETAGRHVLVPQSSGKLLANAACLGSMNGVIRRIKIVNGYTLDTIPGLMIGIIYALTERTPVVHLPLTVDVDKLSLLLSKEGDVQFVGEPSLFRGLTQVPYEVPGKRLRRLFTFGRPREQRKETATSGEDGGSSPAGASGLEKAIEERFGLEMHRGLVLGSAGALISLNVPDPAAETSTAEHQEGHRDGAEGRLFPGIGVEMLDPESGDAVPLVNRIHGDLRLSGLAVEVTESPEASVIRCCRLDKDGFLFLGEMDEKPPVIEGESAPSDGG